MFSQYWHAFTKSIILIWLRSMNVAVLSRTNEHGTSTPGTPKTALEMIFLTCRKMGSMFTTGVCSTLNAAPPHEIQTCKPGRSGRPAWLRLKFQPLRWNVLGKWFPGNQAATSVPDQWCVSPLSLFPHSPCAWKAQHAGPNFPKALLLMIFFAASMMLWMLFFSFFFVLGPKLQDGNVNCEKKGSTNQTKIS